MEYWQKIEGFPDYEVSDHGRVRSRTMLRLSGNPPTLRARRGRVLTPHMNKHGYLRLDLSRVEPDGTVLMRKRYVHILVARHWLDQDPSETVNHKDLDKTNNHWSNLEWLTRVENAEHAIEKYDMRGEAWRHKARDYQAFQ